MSTGGSGLAVGGAAWSAVFFVPWSMEVSLDCVRFGCGVRRMFTLTFPFFRLGEADSSTWTVLDWAALALFLPVLCGSPGVMGDGTSDGGVTMNSSEDDGGDVVQSKRVGLGAGHQPAGDLGRARIGQSCQARRGPTTDPLSSVRKGGTETCQESSGDERIRSEANTVSGSEAGASGRPAADQRGLASEAAGALRMAQVGDR